MTIIGTLSTTLFGGLPVLAAAQWTEVIIPIVVFVIWLINQIAAFNKGKPGPKPQVNRPPNPNAGQNRGPLEEVEQFLREARKAMEAQQRGQQPQRSQPQPPPPKPKPQRQQKQQPKKQEKPATRKPLSAASRLRSPEEEGEWNRAQLGGSVGQHVSEHLGSSKFDERAGRLSQIQRAVDQDIGTHVKSSFDHQLGSLTPQTAASGEPISDIGDNATAALLAMLRDPQSMRNAIILQEILQPPTHRW
jgi:hypothetical protein